LRTTANSNGLIRLFIGKEFMLSTRLENPRPDF
jgi:hypothetical protein